MARKRTIDPDLWTDDRIQGLPSAAAVLFYIGLISFADDEGRIEWNARQLSARIFPLRVDIKQRDVEAWMMAVEESGLVVVYESGGRQYAFHSAWPQQQYVNRPIASKLPAPPAFDLFTAATVEPQQPRKARIPDTVKQDVARRHGCEPGETIAATCAECGALGQIVWARRRDGRPGSWVALVDLEWDHIIQEAHGGPTVADNIRLACRKCNRARNAPAGAPYDDPPPYDGGQTGAPVVDPRGADVMPHVPLVSVSDSVSVSESSSTSRRAPRLALVSAEETTAREILAGVWPRVAEAVGRSMTLTEWRSRNKRAALGMARSGLTSAAVLAAHQRLCTERGVPVWVLSWVQDAVIRYGVEAAPRTRVGDVPMVDEAALR